MCGVIGLVYENHHPRLGRIAAELLKTLEYRGYDSTGAAIQDDGLAVTLEKGVGAPSVMVERLGIDRMAGRLLCGQVRWATFGAVTRENSQPHLVRCKVFLYGAHNGNVTNCDDLKRWLLAQGHEVRSDNDGEMVVHVVEHCFSEELGPLGPAGDPVVRRRAMRAALVRAAAMLQGSYSAVVIDPETRCAWAVKQGSSLYFGFGAADPGGRFAIASSDLSAVLKLTRTLVPLAEGEFVEFSPEGHAIYCLRDRRAKTADGEQDLRAGEPVRRLPVQSRLSARDTALRPGFETYMEQEIADQEDTVRDLVALFRGAGPDAAEAVELQRAAAGFVDLCQGALAAGGRILCVSCGSSFHAAKAGALFFNEIAAAPLTAVLPGEFRAEHSRSLRDGDVLMAVSQSGETKDLIDVLNQVAQSGRQVARVAVVNNLNSTLAQEKCDLVIPLRCGPEIAVPATKSFLNQVAVFYCLALRLGERLARALPPGPERDERMGAVAARLDGLDRLPALVRQTLVGTEAAVEAAAEQLYLAPSMHLLATRITAVALEGALKIREVVLNHTQGYEGSEFKHGPNTILGFNTLFGPAQMEALRRRLGAGTPPPDGAELGALLYRDYPLLYITGPDEHDVNLTISQINTHKIRGASTIVVAEEHPGLRQAAEKAPADNPGYRSGYIPLPPTGDTLLVVFTATVALQRLALRMSLRKMRYLDQLGITGHGVHPDVPKNVSKSITVD